MKQFSENVVAKIKELMNNENIIVNTTEVLKNNGLKLQSITIRTPEEEIVPNVYINDYYKMYQNNEMSLYNIAKEIIENYENNRINNAADINFDVSEFKNFEKIKDKIKYELINTEANKQLLDDCPHMAFMDLSIVFKLFVCGERNFSGTILIRNSHLKLWGITLDELYKAALNNAEKYNKPCIRDLNSVIVNFLEDIPSDEIMELADIEQCGMYILSNENNLNGSACIIKNDTLKAFADKLQSNLYLIPSSIHEWIIVPVEKNTAFEAAHLKSMIKEVNNTQVQIEEILSYELYYYDRMKNKLNIA